RQIDVDLRAWATGPRVGHLPEVVLVAEAIDPRRRQPGDLLPQRERLVVRVVHRDAKQRGIDRELAGDQLPGEANRVSLEVVAEREIAKHLEERMMPRGVADLLEVVVFATGAHA